MPIEKRLILTLALRGEGNEPGDDELVLEVDQEYQTVVTVPAGDGKVIAVRVSSEDLQEAVEALWMFFRGRPRMQQRIGSG